MLVCDLSQTSIRSQHSSKCFNCMCTPYFKTAVMYSRQQTYCIYNEMKAALNHTLEQNQAWLLSNPQEPGVNILLNYSEFRLEMFAFQLLS